MRIADITSKIARAPMKLVIKVSRLSNRLRFMAEGITFGEYSRIEGYVGVFRRPGAEIRIGRRFHLTSGAFINKISRGRRACICAEESAKILIGDNVGMSSPCLWARTSIIIGDNVNVGADCVIMDHDAHSLDYMDRRNYEMDRKKIESKPVVIGNDVLIGAESIILKGVSIGNRSIIGAGSIVTCDIPSDEMWAGVPARFIRKINQISK